MDHQMGSQFRRRRRLNRVAAITIILLTANMTTLLVARAVSAQPLTITPQQMSEH
jgi:hypothetical protein